MLVYRDSPREEPQSPTPGDPLLCPLPAHLSSEAAGLMVLQKPSNSGTCGQTALGPTSNWPAKQLSDQAGVTSLSACFPWCQTEGKIPTQHTGRKPEMLRANNNYTSHGSGWCHYDHTDSMGKINMLKANKNPAISWSLQQDFLGTQ